MKANLIATIFGVFGHQSTQKLNDVWIENLRSVGNETAKLVNCAPVGCRYQRSGSNKMETLQQ